MPASSITNETANGTDTVAPSMADVAARAYEYYQAEGCVHGHAEDHWLRAERDLMKAARPAQEKTPERKAASKPARTAKAAARSVSR